MTRENEYWIDELQSEVDELKRVLRPFIVGGEDIHNLLFDGLPDDAMMTVTARISLGDFRCARILMGVKP
jgi:dihydrofolate reductase